MNHTLARFLFAASLLVTPAFCETPASSEPPLIDYSLTFDAYGETKLNGNSSSANLLRNFDITSDHFEMAAATLTVQIMKGPFGFHFDSGYGQMYTTMNTFDPWGGVNRYFGQAYVSLKPIRGNDLTLDFGKFYTSVGAEVPDNGANYQYSRSLAFTLGSPYYHFGLRATKALTKELTVTAQVMNGWNDVVNNTGGASLGLSATYTKKLFNVTETYLAGPEPVFLSTVIDPLATARPKKVLQLIDSVVKFTPTEKLNAYVEGLYGEEQNALGRDRWNGVAVAAMLPIAPHWSFSPRWEFYNDPTGATSGAAQKLQEVTVTLQYEPALKNMLVRAEVRTDFSDQPFFVTGPSERSKRQETALLAVLYTWKGKK